MSRANETRVNEDPSKSSTASLLAAFRHLTGAKLKPAVVVSPSVKPDVEFEPVIALPSHTIASPIVNRHALSSHSSSSMDAVVEDNPPGTLKLVHDLRHDNQIDQRILAARSLTSLLLRYTGANVLGIWTAARDLLNHDHSHDATTAAYDLLLACVKHKTLSCREKRFFFDSVPAHRRSSIHFIPRFRILNQLTSQGRDLECLEDQILELLVRLLSSCYYAAYKARKDKSLDTTADEANLQAVFDYTLQVIKCNSKILTEVDLELLIAQVLALCTKTVSEADITNSVAVIDALITYSSLPKASLTASITVLCGIYCSVPILQETTWQILRKFFLSHHGPTTTHTLLSILKDGTTAPLLNSNHIRGAVRVLRRAILSQDIQILPQTSMPKLISALSQSLQVDSSRLEADVMHLLLDIIRSSDALSTIFSDKAWTNVVAIVVQSARRFIGQPRADVTADVIEEPTPSKQRQDTIPSEANSIELLQTVSDSLIDLTEGTHSDYEKLVMSLLMQVVHVLSDSTTTTLINYYSEESLLYPSNDAWRGDFEQLFNSVFNDQLRSTSIRKFSLHVLDDACSTAAALNSPHVNDLILLLIRSIQAEEDLSIIEDLCEICVKLAVDTTISKNFEIIVHCLRDALVPPKDESGQQTNDGLIRETSPLAHMLLGVKYMDTFGTIIAKALVRIFLRSVNVSLWKAQTLYEIFLQVAGAKKASADARISVLKVLFRLRADTNHAIFIVSATECDSLAASLCRTEDTVMMPQPKQQESPLQRPTRIEEFAYRRQVQTPSAPAKSLGRTGSSSNIFHTNVGKVNRPTPPLWLYPGPKGLPEEPPKLASNFLYSHLNPDLEDHFSSQTRSVLKISTWLELLIDILQQEEVEWEIYSYVLVHLGAQLTNHALFVNAIPQIKFLRSVISGQLSNKNFHEPPAFTNLKRSDAAICVYHVLTMLVSYHGHLTRNELDDTVKLFLLGIGSWERTSETCIHALSVCCFELPESVVKVLEGILQRMSQIITQGHIAVHILEFLAGLARLPDLWINFREDEFRTVFGICFRYLQSVRDPRAKGESHNKSAISTPHLKPRDMTSPTPQSLPKTLADELPQYIYSLAYHVMTFWFMALKMQDRSKQMPWIAKNLLYTDITGAEVMDEQAQVTIDMMNRVAYSDRDETATDKNFFTSYDGVRATKSWLVGQSIFTIETGGRSGASHCVRRRPSGTRYSSYRPAVVNPPRHQVPISVGTAAEIFYQDDYVGILPDDVLQELYSPLTFTSTHQESLTALPDDESTERSLSAFDRISPLDGHKVGIIYVGQDQYNEVEILNNVMGSADYTSFLDKIGTLTELKGATFNTQGLDREFDSDGKFTYCWRDRVTELVFHVTTMMPTNIEHDPQCSLKKRHIGNDFVNIIFNNSGSSFNLETFPSDFNYVNIVITPEARASFIETRLAQSHNSPPDSTDPSNSETRPSTFFYKVTVLTKTTIPSISPASETKIISRRALPAFVRLLALNASVFAHVWANRGSAGGSGEHVSSWRSRLREIKKLHQRHAVTDMPPPATLSTAAPSNASFAARASLPPAQLPSATAPSTPSPLSPAVPRESAIFRRASAAYIFGGTASESNRHSSGLSSGAATDVDGTSSVGSRD